MQIMINNLSVRLGMRTVVDDVRIDVPDGALLAVIGPNGSGKTTLLRAIYGAVRPVAGSISIGGQDLASVPARRAARLRAVVPQFQHADVGLSAHTVVGTGRHSHVGWWTHEQEADRDAVQTALRQTGAEELAPRAFSTLSGGERQRILLARALAQQAATLLLDEPTNHLDPRAQLDLLALVASLPMTRIAVLHDLDQALAHADLAAVLHQGRLVACGPPAEVLTNDLTTAVFGVRSAVIMHPLTQRPHLVTAPVVRTDMGPPDPT